MENNSDKQLRDKLSGTEFPFDPQAWEQMEAMLDKKKKRRGFFWWWTGGVAAVLVLAIGSLGWGLYLMEEDDKQAYETPTHNETKSEVRSEKSEINTIVAPGSSSKQENLKAKNENLKVNAPVAEIRNQKSEKITAAKNKKQEARNSNHQKAIAHHSTSKKKLKETSLTGLTNKKSSANGSGVLAEANPYQKEIEMLNAASAKATTTEENISLSRREASLLEYVSENATTSFDKKEEDVLPKQKKKIFNYSIGVLANITGASAGKQVGIPEQSTAPYFFCKKPSYMIGFTHDFLFANRVAITNSILFSQTSFDVYHPRSTTFFINPSIYTSHITELAIPIGIKVYPVVKNNFRFYINTGIINHIKLKETFDYTMLDDTAYSNFTSNPNTLADQSTFPVETKFTGSYSPSVFGVQGGSNSTKDFSINSAKRYYASFYAGAGFEYIAKKHFILFTEPMFYMSLQKIGVQDKRKYNIGLTAGFRYQF